MVIRNALAVITVELVKKNLEKRVLNFEKLNSSLEFIALSLQTAELQRVSPLFLVSF